MSDCDETHASTTVAKFIGNTGDSKTHTRFGFCTTKVSAGRVIFFIFLGAVAAILGYGSNKLLADSETRLARNQFDSIVDRALQASLEITLRKRLGIITLASMAAQTFPDAEMWSNININGFEVVSGNLIETSSGRSMGLLPLVTPDQLESFEDHAYNTVFPGRYPEDTGVSSFGRGVFGLDFSLDNEDKRYRETDGATTWGSPYRVMTPFLFHSMGPSILMTNLHSSELFGRVIDDVLTCSMERAEAALDSVDDNSTQVRDCGVLTDILVLTGKTQEVKSGPGAIMVRPIYPANNSTVLTGLISSTIVWEETLINVFESEVSGIDCVLETENQVYTYEITNGVATLK